jgi:F420-dependent oxidoreductase-like protein
MEYCVFVEPQFGAGYHDLLAFAQTAERLGFAGFFRSDHYLTMGAGNPLPGPSDAWTTLAGLARETERVRLGTLVSSVTYRHPGILAIQIANVDAMSGGRAELGLGTGWYRAEHDAYGIPFPEKRFGLLEEQLAIVTGLWTTPSGETFDYHGEHYTLTDSPALPKPVQSRVPVIIGGGGPKRTPELAARYATEYNYFGSADPAGRFDAVRAAAAAIGRAPDDLRYSVATTTFVGRDRAEAERRITTEWGDPAAFLANPNNAIGTVDDAVERISRFADIGASRVYLQFYDLRDLDHLEFVGTEVLPRLP